MSHRVTHCPFLNRADTRCSNHFSLDKLDAAFDHCFGSYLQCGTYQEMLDERRSRQDEQTGQRHEPRAIHANSSRFAALSLPVLGTLAHAHG